MRVRIAALLVGIALFAGAAYWWTRAGPSSAGNPAPPPAEVGVVELVSTEVPLRLQYAGRVAGFRVVEVRAQVGGILLKREYDEGTIVKVGDVLFRIDPRPYEAALARVNAQVAQAQATLIQAEENFNRTQSLASRGVSTQKALDDATGARDQARASLQAARADVETAKLNLEFTIVRSPIDGPTNLTSPPEGALVQAQQTLLTTITQVDPAYVNFTITDQELRAFEEMNKQRVKPITPDDVTVQLQFGDGSKHPQTGKVDTRSRTVDPRDWDYSEFRAVFPNHEGGILPGQFVRVNISGVSLPNAILIPKVALSQGPQGPFVYVIDANSVAQTRAIRLDRETAGGWIVREGLKAGERIVADGVIRVRPGAPVKTVAMATDAKPPAPGVKP